ncbi:[FeFe] hydrogenase H-cluster radical SAM maturase HydG, partial [Candidatus Woesearchaeota archaeon]|nr:[FeFe] hydrogenase H-cluster radical SAM maturase HydG [Candidatus Woesearchaeota archaeon]
NKVSKILKRSLLLRGLSLEDIAVLINISDKKSLDCLFKTALKIKQQIYGNRLVLFAPLYVSNYCSNNCLYCGFRRDNKDLMRKCLTPSQVKEEAKAILHQGHKRILLLMGEDPAACDLDRCLKTISAIYKVRDSKGNSIRRINLEISPMAYKELKKLKSAKIGTYTVFQETYHPETYKLMHPAGKKADYSWRLHTMDRALKSGIKDVGIGALFGLYEYRYEVLALIQHATHLEETYGTGPHTISVPRIKPAQNAPASQKVPCPVSDTDFKKIVAVLRCALPYTGIILSTRESPNMRKELLNLGVSQISAGSKTSPGGYKEEATSSHTEGQFSLEDTRSVAEMIRSVIKQGFIPSFCTACYRSGRVGKDFMDLAKPGLIKLHCLPNALITFQEFLEDYADSRTIKAGEKLIHKELKNIPSKAIRNKTLEYLKMVKKSGRDLYF